MSDRELLELAAKAAGIFCKGWCLPGGRSDGWHGMYTGSDDDGTYVRWNPIADDGDAFKLMVQLRLGTLFPTEIGRDRVNVKGHTESLALNDPLAATRRAIVRAAAEIGRQMP